MKRECFRLPDKLHEEDLRLMHEFCMIDPEGDFDEEAWEAYFAEHASAALKRAKRKEARTLAAIPAGVRV